MDSEQFRRFGKQMIDYVADYLDNIGERPVFPEVSPGYLAHLIPDEAPVDGEPWDEVFKDIERVIMPGMTHWHSPHFHAYFPTANSYPAIIADILSSSLACIGFTWISSPACTELEMSMMDWIGKMIQLPEEFLFCSKGLGGGIIQGTASEATLVALLAAKTRILNNLKDAADASVTKLMAYGSEQSHSSVERAGLMGGVKMRLLPTDDRLSLRGDTLRRAIAEDRAKGFIPFYVVATLGTTNTCAFDNLIELGQICQKENIWLHVDAAYAGSAFICPEYRPLLNGVELADSVNLNLHKMLLVNFDCSTMWVKNSQQLTDAFRVDPAYLKHENEGSIPDYRHWQIPLGRRFRSLKVWFVFRTYGLKGLQNHVRKQISLAQEFEHYLKDDDRFEIVYPATLGLVCFRLKGTNELNEDLHKTLNERRKIHLTPTTVNKRFILRFAVCSRFTEQEDIVFAWDEIKIVAEELLAQL